MKKVLVFTYYWPPASGPGVQRVLKFCKYLSNFGWQPIVVTVKNGSYPAQDESLLQDVPQDIIIYKTKTNEPFTYYNFLRGKKGKEVGVGMMDVKSKKTLLNHLSLYIRANYFVPDARKGWKPYALKEAEKIINSNTIDAVFTSGPPHSTHLIGLELKEKYNLPWIADFRDPWTEIYYNKDLPRTKKALLKDKNLEVQVLKKADIITTVSSGLKKELSSKGKVVTIYNGFDEEDFVDSENITQENFKLTYTGNFKPNQNVNTLWIALHQLIEEEASFKQDLQIQLVGNVDENVLKAIKNNKLSSNTKAVGFVNHKEAINYMKNASMLLFIIPQANNSKLILTGKLFEYLASGTQMLSIGPISGDAAKIIASCNRKEMIEYQDVLSMKKSIKQAYNHWKLNGVCERHTLNDAVKLYSRKGQTKELANLLNKISL